MDLVEKACLVTGATRGIGRAIAGALAAAGADVVISARTSSDVERVAAELDADSAGRVVGIPADVSRPEDCVRLVDETLDAAGRLDVLVNNAGVGILTSIEDLSVEDWETQIDTNLRGVFCCSKAAVPHLKSTEGWIINIGSLAGRNPFAGGTAYNASKFGLVGMTEAMMLDLRHSGIRVSMGDARECEHALRWGLPRGATCLGFGGGGCRLGRAPSSVLPGQRPCQSGGDAAQPPAEEVG